MCVSGFLSRIIIKFLHLERKREEKPRKSFQLDYILSGVYRDMAKLGWEIYILHGIMQKTSNAKHHAVSTIEQIIRSISGYGTVTLLKYTHHQILSIDLD